MNTGRESLLQSPLLLTTTPNRTAPRSMRRSMTSRNSVIDFLDTGQQSIQTQDGSKYVGAWKDGKMHGEGELRGEGGMYYKGMFDMGSMHGNGKLKTVTGTYEGEFKTNKMHGKGTFSGKHGRPPPAHKYTHSFFLSLTPPPPFPPTNHRRGRLAVRRAVQGGRAVRQGHSQAPRRLQVHRRVQGRPAARPGQVRRGRRHHLRRRVGRRADERERGPGLRIWQPVQ